MGRVRMIKKLQFFMKSIIGKNFKFIDALVKNILFKSLSVKEINEFEFRVRSRARK